MLSKGRFKQKNSKYVLVYLTMCVDLGKIKGYKQSQKLFRNSKYFKERSKEIKIEAM